MEHSLARILGHSLSHSPPRDIEKEIGEVQQPTGDFVRDNPELYQVAFDESVRALDQQSNELSAIRQRVVTYLALVVSGTAFLVGSSISRSAEVAGSRDAAFFGLTTLGTVLAVLTVLFVAVTLSPSSTVVGTRSSALKIIKWNIEAEVPAPSRGALLRTLAIQYDYARLDNEEVLGDIRRTYVRAIVCGAAQLAVWAVLAWVVT